MTEATSTSPSLCVPQDYMSRANDFYGACRSLPDFHPQYMPLWAQLALFGLAIELVLKAFLLSRNLGAAELKKSYGHNLGKLHLQALKLGLPESARTERMVRFINETYTLHVPRYPDPDTRGMAIATVPQFYGDYDDLVNAVTNAITVR